MTCQWTHWEVDADFGCHSPATHGAFCEAHAADEASNRAGEAIRAYEHEIIRAVYLWRALELDMEPWRDAVSGMRGAISKSIAIAFLDSPISEGWEPFARLRRREPALEKEALRITRATP